MLARASLSLLLAMTLPACLVTSSPTFEEPTQTRPFLLSESTVPDLRRIKVVNTAESLPLEFSASVLSEDVGADVVGRLVLDYGIAEDQRPYRQPLGDPASVAAATLDDGPRTLTARWESTYKPTLGCHYVSLLATHKLNFATGCPENPDDFDFLTWTVIVCDSNVGPCCDPTAPEGDKDSCAVFSCPDVDENVRCQAAPGGAP